METESSPAPVPETGTSPALRNYSNLDVAMTGDIQGPLIPISMLLSGAPCQIPWQAGTTTAIWMHSQGPRDMDVDVENLGPAKPTILRPKTPDPKQSVSESLKRLLSSPPLSLDHKCPKGKIYPLFTSKWTERPSLYKSSPNNLAGTSNTGKIVESYKSATEDRVGGPIGLGKSAKHAWASRKAMKDGTFEVNEAKLLAWQKKILEVDQHSVATAWLQAGPIATAGPHYGLASQATGVAFMWLWLWLCFFCLATASPSHCSSHS